MVEPDKDTHADVLDAAKLGQEPSANYLERVQALDNLIRECIQISKAYEGIRSPTGRHFWASVLFTAMITRAVSLAIAAPHSPWAQKLIEHWDYATLTGIVRTILEVRIAFYYLCIDPCSADEWDCRWNVFNLHDCLSRKKLFEVSGTPEEAKKFDEQAEDLRNRLRANSFFVALQSGQKKNLLSGRTAFLYPLEEIAEKAGVDRQQFKFLYVLFSSHVHSLPMSFYRIGDERGRGLPTPAEEGYTCLCLSFALTLLIKSRDEMRKLFADLPKKKG